LTKGDLTLSIVGPHPSPLLKEREQIPFSDQDSAFLEKNSAQKVTLSLTKGDLTLSIVGPHPMVRQAHHRHLLLKEREQIPFSDQDSAFLEKNSAKKVTLSIGKLTSGTFFSRRGDV
jgi:hypothetical protein